jgi:hypothetical protein
MTASLYPMIDCPLAYRRRSPMFFFEALAVALRRGIDQMRKLGALVAGLSIAFAAVGCSEEKPTPINQPKTDLGKKKGNPDDDLGPTPAAGKTATPAQIPKK